jgi:hypothetical protein
MRREATEAMSNFLREVGLAKGSLEKAEVELLQGNRRRAAEHLDAAHRLTHGVKRAVIGAIRKRGE